NPDRGRPDPVAHDALGDRASGAAGGQSDEGLSGFADADRGAAAGHAGAAIARPAVSRIAAAACAAARASSGTARRRDVRRHRQDKCFSDRAGNIPAGAVRQSTPGLWRSVGPSQHAGLDRAARARRRRRWRHRLRTKVTSARRPGLLHARPWQVAMIGLGTAATQLDTAVNIAFPAITKGFGLSIGDIQWVVISYVLTYASLLLALGRIGDSIGHALVFRIGLICSAVALLLVSVSPS